MAKFRLSDIDMAFEFVGSARHGTNCAVLCKDTGRILYRSDMAGIDETDDEDNADWDQRIEVPHPNDLDLGTDLVFEFVEEYLPEDRERVCRMFRCRGAYSRFKDLLQQRDLLQKWYDVENSRKDSALRNWCRENGIELDG